MYDSDEEVYVISRSLKPVPVRGKKKCVFAQRPVHLFPVVILVLGNRQGTLACRVTL